MTVTGSKYMVTKGNAKVLVDCGQFQGYKQLRLRNWGAATGGAGVAIGGRFFVTLSANGRTVVFSGDLGRPHDLMVSCWRIP